MNEPEGSLSSKLLAPFRLLREARQILNKRDAKPSPGALLRCWLRLKWDACIKRPGPCETKIGSWRVSAFNAAECGYLFWEVFIRDDYQVSLEGPAPFILDCGANIGLATLYFKLHYPQSVIHCFEPNPNSFALLQKNMTANALTNVTLHQTACGKQAGAITFYIDPVFSPKSSVLPGRSPHAQPHEVKVVKLSDYIDREVDLLKLDVEGAEWDVFADLRNSGALSRIKRMIIEYHHRVDSPRCEFGRFLQMLEDANFTYDIFSDIPPRWRWRQANQDIVICATRLG
jgi:FkbM family methyltransferase